MPPIEPLTEDRKNQQVAQSVMHSKLAEYREKRAEQQAREVSASGAISPERTTVDNSIKPRGQNDIQISKKDEEEY